MLFAGSLGKNVKVRLAGGLALYIVWMSDGEIFVLNLISRLAGGCSVRIIKVFLFSL